MRGAAAGATITAPIFLIVGLGEVLVPASVCPSCKADVRDAGGNAQFVISGVVAGAVFGGVIGALVGKEHWVDADAGWHVSFDPFRRGLRVGWSLW